MSDRSAQREILIATTNPGKFRETSAILSEPYAQGPVPDIQWRSLGDLAGDIPEPVEDGQTFAENAALKARYYAAASGMWALADDSGLEVDALGGAPGVISARYGQSPPGTPREVVSRANNEKLIAAVRGIPDEQRTARFRCVMAVSDGASILAVTEGAIEGRIIDRARGSGGFGYDPHFLVPHLGKTTAELPADEKNRISHRGQAVRLMRERLRELLA